MTLEIGDKIRIPNDEAWDTMKISRHYDSYHDHRRLGHFTIASFTGDVQGELPRVKVLENSSWVYWIYEKVE